MTEINGEQKLEEIKPRVKKRNKIKKWIKRQCKFAYVIMSLPKMILIDGFIPYP